MTASRPGALLVSVSAAASHQGDVQFLVEPAEAVRGPLPRGAVVAVGRQDREGARVVEVVVDGWRFEFEVRDAGRAELRQRASRPRAEAGPADGPLEIRAIIPGRVAAVTVVAGDAVLAGQAVLVVEAMKMQNELRVPRNGTVSRVAVTAGETIEVGDLLLVLA
ncbi:MAG: biotin/lipoyl-containing protein [Candidatus Limnocylindrales bacterium]